MVNYLEELFVVATENIPGIARPQPSLNTTYVVYTCEDCGALVRDMAYHDAWHDNLQKLFENVFDRLDNPDDIYPGY
jgi:hypothetical protein